MCIRDRGYTTQLPPDFTNLNAKAKIGADAISAVYGLFNIYIIFKIWCVLTYVIKWKYIYLKGGAPWVYGSSANILYIASGGSEDWAQATAGIKYAYCLELRPSQTGVDSSYGFTLPEDRYILWYYISNCKLDANSILKTWLILFFSTKN